MEGLNKKQIRKEIIKLRDEFDINEKKIADEIILKKLLLREEYIKCKNIFIYIGFGSEIDTRKYIKRFWQDNKTVVVPRTNIEKKEMDVVRIDSFDNLVKDNYGILEPDQSKESFNKDKIDLIIMPGVAFDKDGGRVGYGGGYYDKFLKTIDKNIKKIALCYTFQIIQKVPLDFYDVKVNDLITNK